MIRWRVRERKRERERERRKRGTRKKERLFSLCPWPIDCLTLGKVPSYSLMTFCVQFESFSAVRYRGPDSFFVVSQHGWDRSLREGGRLGSVHARPD